MWQDMLQNRASRVPQLSGNRLTVIALILLLLVLAVSALCAPGNQQHPASSTAVMAQSFPPESAVDVHATAVRREMAVNMATGQPVNYFMLFLVAAILHFPLLVGIGFALFLLMKAAIQDDRGEKPMMTPPGAVLAMGAEQH